MIEVDPDNFAVPFAYRDGQTVHLKDFDGRRDGLVCGGCKKPVIFKKGVDGRRSPHFAHKADGQGGCNLMTMTHRIFRDALASLIQAEGGLPTSLLIGRPWASAGDLVPGEAVAERTIPGTPCLADVLFTPAAWPGTPLALEVVVSHGVTPEKRAAVLSSGAAIAAMTVKRDLGRFADCSNEAEQYQVAVDEIRRLRFRLLSETKKVVVSPADRVIERATVTSFQCRTGAGAHAEYRQAVPSGPLVARAAMRAPVGPTTRHGREDGYTRMNRIMPSVQEMWAREHCPVCLSQRRMAGEVVAPYGGKPVAWHCRKHNLRGAV